MFVLCVMSRWGVGGRWPGAGHAGAGGGSSRCEGAITQIHINAIFPYISFCAMYNYECKQNNVQLWMQAKQDPLMGWPPEVSDGGSWASTNQYNLCDFGKYTLSEKTSAFWAMYMQSKWTQILQKFSVLEIMNKALAVLTLLRAGPSAVSKVRGGADLPPLGF